MWATGTHAYDKEQKLSPIYFKVHVAGCIVSGASFIALNDAPYGREGERTFGYVALRASTMHRVGHRHQWLLLVVVVVGILYNQSVVGSRKKEHAVIFSKSPIDYGFQLDVNVTYTYFVRLFRGGKHALIYVTTNVRLRETMFCAFMYLAFLGRRA